MAIEVKPPQELAVPAEPGTKMVVRFHSNYKGIHVVTYVGRLTGWIMFTDSRLPRRIWGSPPETIKTLHRIPDGKPVTLN
jgi:hypothetical protein